MANQYYNFYYDPSRQGFDPLAWRSLFGTPAVSSQLTLSDCEVIHLADILRCDAYFNVILTAPAVGDDKKFGLIQYNKNAYIYFRILNNVLTAETSDGVTAYSTPITWQSEWSNVNTTFRIKWEAGAAKFYIGGVLQLQATIGYSAPLNVPESVVPGDPLSLYLSDFSASTDLVLNYIDVKEIQSYILQTSNSSVITGDTIHETDIISITEAITSVASLAGNTLSDQINISDILTDIKSTSDIDLLFESLSITEDISILIPELPVDLFDSLNITEDTVVEIDPPVDLFDSLNITEDIVVDPPA